MGIRGVRGRLGVGLCDVMSKQSLSVFAQSNGDYMNKKGEFDMVKSRPFLLYWNAKPPLPHLPCHLQENCNFNSYN